ncbi:MAG: hypothetical protein KIS78_12700 [Labilithrix sp.]|nr:hypothetical protein [Labilithrix sp.]
MRPFSWGAVTLASTALAFACVDDFVLPDAEIGAVCGNGVLEPGEACDVRSPGCVSCAILPNWTCRSTGCSPVCGDGVVGSGADCADARRVEPCDMSGYWATREANSTRDAIVGALQSSSNWFLFRFEQDGDSFRVVESLDCGVHVTGTVTVDSTPGTLRSSMYANRMDGADGARRARRGTSRRAGAGCEVTFERWYKVRGATDAYLPVDFDARPTLASLPPLPSADDPVNDTHVPEGSVDPDGDGIPGTSFRITGFVSGIRNAAQRDWKEYATAPGAPAPASVLTFAIPGSFDLEESVLRVTECGNTCGLIASSARAATDLPGSMSFSYIGRALGTPRVDGVVAGPPRANVDDDLTTCANVRLLLPHEGGP